MSRKQKDRMAARVIPFYEPKTEEGRRLQTEVRLQKAREAERRARLEAQSRVSYQHHRTVAQPLAADESGTTDQPFAEEAARLVSPSFLIEMQTRQSYDDPYTFFAKDPSTGKLLAWKSHPSRLGAVWALYNEIFPDAP